MMSSNERNTSGMVPQGWYLGPLREQVRKGKESKEEGNKANQAPTVTGTGTGAGAGAGAGLDLG